MSNVDAYLNQSIVWKHVASISAYNEKTFATSVTIKGRSEDAFKLIRNDKGDEVVSSGKVFTKSAISVGDLLDGRIVIASEPKRGLSGNVEFYEVFLT